MRLLDRSSPLLTAVGDFFLRGVFVFALPTKNWKEEQECKYKIIDYSSYKEGKTSVKRKTQVSKPIIMDIHQ